MHCRLLPPTPRLLRAGVLSAATLLAACTADDPKPYRQLLSVTVTNASGEVTSVSNFDYVGNSLVRVRAYNQPGPDGIIGTADDPPAGGSRGGLDRLVAGGGYTNCDVSQSAGGRLHDPYAEQSGDNRLQRLFTILTDCTLPGQSASRVTSTYITSPGADGEWLTADDVASGQATLERTPGGSLLQYVSWPPAEAYGTSGTAYSGSGLDNIVYDPYAGLDLTPPPMSIQYGYDNRGRVSTLQSAAYTQHVSYADDGFVTLRELTLPPLPEMDPNIVVILPPLPRRFREEYRRLDAHRTTVESYALMEESAYATLIASPTGQILAAILGWSSPGQVTLEGQVFVKLANGHYLVDRSAGDTETVTQLGDSGSDGRRFTADDEVIATATLRFSPGPEPQDGNSGARPGPRNNAL